VIVYHISREDFKSDKPPSAELSEQSPIRHYLNWDQLVTY